MYKGNSHVFCFIVTSGGVPVLLLQQTPTWIPKESAGTSVWSVCPCSSAAEKWVWLPLRIAICSKCTFSYLYVIQGWNISIDETKSTPCILCVFSALRTACSTFLFIRWTSPLSSCIPWQQSDLCFLQEAEKDTSSPQRGWMMFCTDQGTLWFGDSNVMTHQMGFYLFQVSANTDSSMSGYLQRSKGNKKQGKRLWFVIKDKVLYTYAASEVSSSACINTSSVSCHNWTKRGWFHAHLTEVFHCVIQDVAALESQPLLGFMLKVDSSQKLQFKLYHKNTLYYIFKADDIQTAQRYSTKSGATWLHAVTSVIILITNSFSFLNRWIDSFKEATVL